MDDNTTTAGTEWIHVALERHGAALIRYATGITGDPDLARDVVQDTFTRLCRETPERVAGHLAEWLFTVCRNRAIDMQRQRQRLITLDEENFDTAADPSPGPSAAAEFQDTLTQALAQLETLPARQQEVIRLKFQAGLSYEEIGRVTQLTPTNVGFILHTALKTLRTRLQRTA